MNSGVKILLIPQNQKILKSLKIIDESVKYHGKLNGKVGGAFSTSANVGGGNETTILSILQAMLIHGMIIQGNPNFDHYGPVAIEEPTDKDLEKCRFLGKRIVQLGKKLFG
jgi:NAD(P)H dehydrogenase (quinone)